MVWYLSPVLEALLKGQINNFFDGSFIEICRNIRKELEKIE